MKIALVGQPNSGKSTLFNAVAGYRSLTSNFAGTTVEYTHGEARVGGEVLELIDLPGLYSLTPTSPVEEVSRDYLLGGDWDVIVNVLDASQLARSLELTLELLDLESPLVVCLNMMDEAARKGMTIDTHALEIALGVPVVEAIGGARSRYSRDLPQRTGSGHDRQPPAPLCLCAGREGVIEQLAEKIAAGPRPVAPAASADSRIMGRCRDYATEMLEPEVRSFRYPAPELARPRLSRAPHGRALFVGGLRTLQQARETEHHSRPAAAVAELFLLTATSPQLIDICSLITHHQRHHHAVSFLPARFRALQWVQSDPRQIRREEPEIAPTVEWAQAESPCAPGSPPTRPSPPRGMRPASPSLSGWRTSPGRGPTGASRWTAWPCIPSGATRC